jgi:hypothetical protein
MDLKLIAIFVQSYSIIPIILLDIKEKDKNVEDFWMPLLKNSNSFDHGPITIQ